MSQVQSLDRLASVRDLRTKAATRSDIVELIRLALVIASDRKLDSFREWLLLERNGYGKAPVPSYRRLKSRLIGSHPLYGVQVVSLPTSDWEELVLEIPCRNSISELIAAAMNSDGTAAADELECPLPADVHRPLAAFLGVPGARYTRRIQHCQFVKLFEGVRDRIFDEALALEDVASGPQKSDRLLSISSQREPNVTNISIGNFQGNFVSDVSGGSVQLNHRAGTDAEHVSHLLDILKNIGLPDTECRALESANEQDQQHGDMERPKSAVKQWLSALPAKLECGAIDIGTGVSANLIASLVAQQLGLT